MSEHSFGKVYKVKKSSENLVSTENLSSNNNYRQCYNCELIEVSGYDGWVISIHSRFIESLTDYKTTPSCNELRMMMALG